MEIIDIKDLEDCFDGTFIKEVFFDKPTTKEFIDYLGRDGYLQYYSSFAKPFFKIETKGRYLLKGIEGNKHLRIVLFKKNLESSIEYFKRYVYNYICK